MLKRTAYFVVLLLLLASASHARITKLTAKDMHRLLTENFQVITHTAGLPISVRNEFARASHGQIFEMADPGQEYQATDVVSKEGLPSRRLIFAGLTRNLCLLHYQHGGFAPGYDLLLFHLSGGKVRYVWHGWARHSIPNVSELRKNMRSHQINDGDSDYI